MSQVVAEPIAAAPAPRAHGALAKDALGLPAVLFCIVTGAAPLAATRSRSRVPRSHRRAPAATPAAEAFPARSTQSSEPASRSWQSRWTSWPSRASACARLAL